MRTARAIPVTSYIVWVHGQFRQVLLPGCCLVLRVPVGSPTCGEDVAIYVFHINQPSLPTPFYSVLVSSSVLMALSTVFHSKNSPANSLLSHSVLPVLFLLCWSFQLYIFL